MKLFERNNLVKNGPECFIDLTFDALCAKTKINVLLATQSNIILKCMHVTDIVTFMFVMDDAEREAQKINFYTNTST